MRKERVFIDENAHIQNLCCEVNLDGGIPKATISFDNLGYGVITAIKFCAQGFNAFNDIVLIEGKDSFFLIVQDISIDKNSRAEGLTIQLPDSDIRRLELKESQICFADGTVATYKGAKEKEIELDSFEEPETEEEELLFYAIQDVISDKVKYIPQEDDTGWICGCGRYNPGEYSVCTGCGVEKSTVFQIADPENYEAILERQKELEEENSKIEQEKEAKKRKANMIKGIIVVFAVIVGILLIRYTAHAITLSKRTTYSSEEEMKTALQGTYTYYLTYGNSKRPGRSITINGDTATYSFPSLDSTVESEIREWNYKEGTIRTVEELVITSEGNLKDGEDVYERNRYSYRSASSSSSSSSSRSGDSYESAYSALHITVDRVQSNSSYTICTGSVKNDGNKTYKFVTLKGSFKDARGNVVDTDWTYGVGAEGLAPGESTTFRLSVPKNYDIVSCSISIMDYD